MRKQSKILKIRVIEFQFPLVGTLSKAVGIGKGLVGRRKPLVGIGKGLVGMNTFQVGMFAGDNLSKTNVIFYEFDNFKAIINLLTLPLKDWEYARPNKNSVKFYTIAKIRI